MNELVQITEHFKRLQARYGMQSMHMQDITEWLMAHSSPTVDLMPKIVRITTVPLSLQVLLRGQLAFMKAAALT